MTVIADDRGADQPWRHHGRREHRLHGRDRPTWCSRSRCSIPSRTAATGRRLGIESDARTRFERGVDPAMVLPGIEYATRLILELCGGEASAPIVPARCPSRPAPFTFRIEQLEAACRDRAGGGGGRGAPAGARASRSSGEDAEAVRVTPPTWRHDVTHGGGHRRGAGPPSRLRPRAADAGAAHRGGGPPDAHRGEQRCARPRGAALAAARAGRGGHLVVHRARSSRRASAATRLRLRNPINAELSVLRPSLLPNLLSAAVRNQSRGQARRRAVRGRRALLRRPAGRAGGDRGRHPGRARSWPALGSSRRAGRRVRRARRCARGARRLQGQARRRQRRGRRARRTTTPAAAAV